MSPITEVDAGEMFPRHVECRDSRDRVVATVALDEDDVARLHVKAEHLRARAGQEPFRSNILRDERVWPGLNARHACSRTTPSCSWSSSRTSRTCPAARPTSPTPSGSASCSGMASCRKLRAAQADSRATRPDALPRVARVGAPARSKPPAEAARGRQHQARLGRHAGARRLWARVLAELALALSILVAAYRILRDEVPCDELGGDYFVRHDDQERLTRRSVCQLERLGRALRSNQR
jgi:hypothetical protein